MANTSLPARGRVWCHRLSLVSTLLENSSNFRRLQENLSRVGQTRRVTLSELFNPQFMRNNTKFATFEALLDGSGKKLETNDDVVAFLQTEDWNQHVRLATRFSSWSEMQEVAGAENTQDELMKGLR